MMTIEMGALPQEVTFDMGRLQKKPCKALNRDSYYTIMVQVATTVGPFCLA